MREWIEAREREEDQNVYNLRTYINFLGQMEDLTEVFDEMMV
jgi:hypothetical protein